MSRPTARYLPRTDRAALLKAIARSKAWVDTIVRDAIDFGKIARRENLAERHVRFLAPLAYLSPRIVEAIAEGRAPGNLNVSTLVRALPLELDRSGEAPRSWLNREHRRLRVPNPSKAWFKGRVRRRAKFKVCPV